MHSVGGTTVGSSARSTATTTSIHHATVLRTPEADSGGVGIAAGVQ